MFQHVTEALLVVFPCKKAKLQPFVIVTMIGMWLNKVILVLFVNMADRLGST